MGLSIASMVLGICALFSGAVTGIPAVITGWMALAKKQRMRGMAIAGLVSGAVGTLVITVVWAAIFIYALAAAGKTEQEKVWRNMGFVETAMENWYVSHNAIYPGPEVSWDPMSREQGMVHCFPDGDPDPLDGDPVPGEFPVNPYTDEPYEYGLDLFYYPDWPGPGLPDAVESTDPNCVYNGLSAPEGKPGTIVVLGWSRDVDGRPRVERYVVVGFDDDTEQPIHSTETRGGTCVWTYRVRLN